MIFFKHLLSVSVGSILCVSSFAIGANAQQPLTEIMPTPMAASPAMAKSFTLQQILSLTVHQAWLMSGKDEGTFFDIVTQLAIFSAKNRDLQLPQTKEAGQQVGDMIKTMAKEDTDQLLYAIVDAAVRKVGTPLPSPTAQ